MSFGQRKLDREKPEIDFPEGDAPTELVIQDLIEGKGAEVVPGSRVLAHYVGEIGRASCRERVFYSV